MSNRDKKYLKKIMKILDDLSDIEGEWDAKDTARIGLALLKIRMIVRRLLDE